MGSLDFASGIIGGYFDQVAQERARKEQNSLQAAQFLLQTGRVRDFNDLLPFLGPLMEKSPFGSVLKKGGQGKGGGKGKAGGGDPSSILSAFINPMIGQGQGQRGQPGPPGSGTLAGPSAGAAPGLPPSQGAAPAQSSETTRLSPDEERRFRAWATTNQIPDVDHPQSFYDYRGYWRDAGDKPVRFGVDHFPDTYKQHGHPTFSVESKYSTGPGDGGRWVGSTFVPGQPIPQQPQPSQQPQQPRGPLMSDDEALQRQMTARRAEGAVDTETSLAKTEAERKDRERFITGFNARFPESQIKGRDFQEYVATGKWPTTYRPVSLPGTIKGSDLPEGTLDIFDQPRDPTKTYRVREMDGIKEYIPTVPTGAAQREYSQATQDKISEELALMGTGKSYSTATDTERYQALEHLAKRDAKKFDQNAELQYARLILAQLAAKAKKDEEETGYQGQISGEPPDPATANVPDRKLGGLTPGAIYEDALMFGTLGPAALAGRGLSNKGPTKLQKDAIQNVASARARSMGIPLSAIQAEYRGLRAATQQALSRTVQIEAGRNVAEANLDLALQLSGAVDRTSMPFINDKLQRMARACSPAVGLNACETAVYTSAREYARVTTAPASGAQLTVSAAQRVDELIRAADTPEGFAVKVATMKKDMANVRSGYDQTIRDIYTNAPSVAAFLGIRPPAATVPQGGQTIQGATGTWTIVPRKQ